MTQCKWTKHNDPGKWMAAVSGTIEEGEDYDENIAHEAEEEIGLTDLKFRKGFKEFIDDGKHKFFAQWYFAEVDKDRVTIKIQEEEVEGYKWVPREELVKEVDSNPDKFVPSLKNSLNLLGII
jgi:isopentenyl-diphosphate Delta-isomerase